jgi:uncharacterized protein DUF6916
MPASFTADTFAELTGDEFEIELETGERFALRLAAAAPMTLAPTDGPAPFSILFRGPETPILPQRSYPIEHPALGRFDVFLVPLGADDRGARYEAAFT